MLDEEDYHPEHNDPHAPRIQCAACGEHHDGNSEDVEITCSICGDAAERECAFNQGWALCPDDGCDAWVCEDCAATAACSVTEELPLCPTHAAAGPDVEIRAITAAERAATVKLLDEEKLP